MKTTALAAALALAAVALTLTGCGESETTLIASARDYVAKKDHRAAIIQLKNVLQANPQSAEARYLLGKSLLDAGDPVAGVVELRKALDLKVPDDKVVPELARGMLMSGEGAKVVEQFEGVRLVTPLASSDLLTTLAMSHALQNDLAKARQATDAALQAQPGYGPALIMLARLKAAANDADAALLLLDDVLAKQPADERAGLLKGELLWLSKRNPEAAMEVFNKVLETHPNAVPAHTAVISILFGQKKDEAARTQFMQMKKAAPNHPETLYFEAQFAFNDKDYKRSREITDAILKLLPNSVRVLELAGAAEYRMKSYVQAEAFLGRALKLAPALRTPRQMLAQTYLRSNQPVKALSALEPVLEAKDADGISLALAGEAHLMMGDARAAEAAFQRAAKAAPGDARVRTTVAMAKASSAEPGQALAELESIAAEDKGSRADLALISARLQRNDLAGALKAIDALQQKVPNEPLAYNLRGRVQMLQRDMAAASASFEAALAKDPKYFPSIASLAAIALDAGKPDAARKRLDDALKNDPKNFQLAMALAELSARTGAAPAEVTRQIGEAVRLNPSEAAPRLLLVNQLLAAGDTKGALNAAQEASAALPTNLDVMATLGRAQLAAGGAQAAVGTYTKLASAQPNDPLHQLRLAEAYVANKDHTGAARSLRKALEIRPDLAAAKRAQVMLAVLDNRPADALALTRDMQKTMPKDPLGFALEGDVEAQRKNWAAAATAYRSAQQRRPGTEIAIKLHSTLFQGGQRAEADKVAAEWMKSQPKDAAFAYYLGDFSLARRENAAAEGWYRQVIELQPRNALAYNNVAWLMAQSSKPGAVAMAEKAVALLPDRAPLLDTLATALAAENQLPKAIETQKRAIEKAPQDASLRLNLARHFIKAGNKDQARAELESLQKLGSKFGGQGEVAELLKTV